MRDRTIMWSQGDHGEKEMESWHRYRGVNS